jgi:hypothetical protein
MPSLDLLVRTPVRPVKQNTCLGRTNIERLFACKLRKELRQHTNEWQQV